MNGSFVDEKDIGKVFDRRLVGRLLGLLKPYLGYVVISVFFLIIAAGTDLVYPHVTRTVIDRHIARSGRKVKAVLGVPSVQIGVGIWFVSQDALNKVDPRVLRSAERAGHVFPERYYYIDDYELTPPQAEVMGRYPDLFERYPGVTMIRYDLLKRLAPHDTYALRGRDLSNVLRIGVIFLVIILVGALANFVHIYYQQYAGQLFMHDLRMRIFRKLQELDLSFFDRNPIGRLVTRATNDVEAINEALANVFATLFRDVLLLVGIVVILFSINIRLALIAFTVVPLVLVLTSYFRIRARDIYRRVRTRLARLNAALQENLSGIRVIKIFSQERSNQARFDDINKDYLEANLQEVVLMSFFRPVVEIISSLGIGLVLYYGGGRVITGELSLGVLVAFVAYVEMFFRPIRELTESYTILQSAMASSERIFILLDEPVRITSAQQAVALEAPRGEIEFKDVWFAYGPTASAKSESEIDWVLKNVSFKVMPGERVAIVGPTGAGKTSIISLISRLYDVQKGEILIDGINVKDLALPSLRSRIGVVMQDVFLFAGDIKSNIRLNLDLEDERVREVAAHINADKFIDRFPNKYDEAVMERGITLSTGERQLLSFARVLAFDPKILVLDEATASIDSETERLIQDGMQRLVMGRTAIIIAHRLSTIREVDRIYVIHRGEIKEVGNHDELVKKKGIYHSLLKLQSIQ